MAGHKTTHTQTERYQIIDRIINSNIYPSFEYILKTLRAELQDNNISPSTVHRDLKYMQEFMDAPISYNRGKNGYCYDNPFCFPYRNLTAHEIEVICLTKKMLSNYGKTNPVYNEALEILKRMYPKVENQTIEERVCVSKSPVPVFDRDVFEKVLYALRENYCLDFVYKSKWEPGKNHRVVKPYQLIMDKGQLYLFAADENYNQQVRLYCFARMFEVSIIRNKHFVLPEKYSFFEDFEKGRFGAFQYDEEYDFEIAVYGEARNELHEFIWAENQQLEEYPDENKTVIKFSSSQWIPIQKWILSFGSEAVPLEPDWLVDWWKKEISKMLKKISK